MQSKLKTILVTILGLGTLLLVGPLAAAGPDTGNSPLAGGCPYGYNGCGRGGCSGNDTTFSKTQIEDIRRQKEAFYNATLDLRKSIVAKQSALDNELSKQEPDAGRAGDLQNELNDLKGKFNQQYLHHTLAMKKLIPGYGAAPRQPAGSDNRPPCCSDQ